ncbi:MAG: hypothetical protein GYA17_08955 [Chloroflexi bacterium]|nr:zinc ribbon domain-containing protein [Anaerolineaceae bacterium]NMB88476.1 hypothetical protein [Chloroflexota bacterium]
MPDYEYRCLDCHKRFALFLKYDEYGKVTVLCAHCGSSNVQRRIGRIRVLRGDESRLEEMADPANLDGIDDDPRALGRMMRQMSSQMGEDMGPEFTEVVHRLEAGQTPDQIEKDMPDMGDADATAGGGGGALDLGDDF